jgi:transcriptional regulator GlxA family with amidase domain
MTTRIGIFIFPNAEELDWAGPWEVLSYWALTYPDDDVEVFTLSERVGPIECAKGLRVLTDYTWDTAPEMDVVIYPGGQGTRPQLGDETYRKWVRGLAESGTLMTSVCTGALVFADAGLLDNRPATTYWSAMELLGSLGTNIELRPDDRFVDSGEVITAAGVSAGIDMALHLVARLHSVERAKEVRRGIQYDPEPPI